jgi:hypothetical protein
MHAKDPEENMDPLDVHNHEEHELEPSTQANAKCELCGAPMPPGEEMFKFHGYSGPCPKPPLPSPAEPVDEQLESARGAVSLATPGEWYVWQNSEERTVQLMSRTHGSITPRLPLSAQTVGDLNAAALAVNLARRGEQHGA